MIVNQSRSAAVACCARFSAGLESLKRLQQLSLDHNELISTAGLSDTFTLLHLSCSHNHLTGVEGLENNALLHTLDLSANSLAEVKHTTESGRLE